MKKKKQYATCALDFTSPKEGEGGGGLRVGYMLDVSPSVTFLKVYFGPTNSTTISDSWKALLVLLCKLECFAVCWGFKFCLVYKLKGWKHSG